MVSPSRLWSSALRSPNSSCPGEVVTTARRGLKLNPDDIELNYLEASAHHALGDFEAALHQYTHILGLSPTDSHTSTLQGMAFYQREIAAYTVSKLDLPFAQFRLDYELNNELKEAWVRKQSPLSILPAYRPLPIRLVRNPPLIRFSPQVRALIAKADEIGRRTQYFVDGFMPHKRQHRMAGLAALDLMQRVNATWQHMIEERKARDGDGEEEGERLRESEGDDKDSRNNKNISGESDGDSSEGTSSGRSSNDKRASGRGAQRGSRRKTPRVSLKSSAAGKRSNGRDKPIGSSGRSNGAQLISGWRDMFDGIIRWRQHAEPCDTITWIDQLKNEYPKGFGTITAMRVGQMHNLKYYPFQDWAFEVMRSVLLETEMASNATNWPLPVPRRVHGKAIEAAGDFGDLHRVVGENFFVTTQCYSEAFPGRVMNGTQLTLVEASGSYDFTIRTAVTPERSAEFFQELHKTWEELSEAATDTHLRATDFHLYRQRVREGVLRMGYYWYQFMPLTRGSAMVGIISILGLSLAADMETLSLIPKDVQVDWEAILNPRFKQFNDSVSPCNRADSGARFPRADLRAGRYIESVRLHASWGLLPLTWQQQRQRQQGEWRGVQGIRGGREARRKFRVYAGANFGEERWSLKRAGSGLDGSDTNEGNSNDINVRDDSNGGELEGEGRREEERRGGVKEEGGEVEGEGEEVGQGQVKKPLHVVLVCPQIPGNTGSIARTCAATAVPLHLVKPLGFDITDSKLKRAGLDYWPYVVVNVHDSWGTFMEYFNQQPEPKRLIAFSKRGSVPHHDIQYQPGDWLLFGAETFGLPPEAMEECSLGDYGGGIARIPIDETYVRSLNLAVSAGVGVYEALRQIEGHADDTVVRN
ncbi:unnamed protein product [Closterium sp. Yama58-4]|nr:unnamed protein product [Closterium sp. Yama58-4]